MVKEWIDRCWKRESGISPSKVMNVKEGACGIGNVDGEALEDANGEAQGDAGEVSEEAMRVRKLVDPKNPSQPEVDEHFLSHLPFRN